MFRTLLATTAVAALLTTGAVAQTTTAPATPAPATESAPVARADGYLASNLIGETVYNGTGENAENIGSVNDLVVNADGQVEQVVVGVGGFLGLGEKNVALSFDEIDWAERDGDRWIVVSATSDQLRELPAFDRAAYEPAPATASNAPAADTGTAAGTTAMAPATTPSTTAPAAGEAAAPSSEQTAAIDKSTLKPLDTATIKSEDLVGTTVYGANDERVGEIGDVVMQGDKVDSLIVDVGGFLGMGEKEVAVGMDNLEFMTDEDGDNYLYTRLTKEQLEAQPAYDEAGYAQGRDQMRMVVPN